MTKTLFTVALLSSGTCGWATAQPINPVVQWNRTLLGVVRTPGAQPPTIHPTRSFAIMHAAIYDAVDAIAATHVPYAVSLSGVSPQASQDAAAAAAAHDVLAALYPSFRAVLDARLQDSLSQVPDGTEKDDGLAVGQTVAARMLALREADGSSASPTPFTFGSEPGDYQSTPPNFPTQPQFTHWSAVRPFALSSASQFRPGPPPRVTSRAYRAALAEVESLGVAPGTAATADQMLTGRFWNGAIQNYWNEIGQTAAVGLGLSTAETARLFALLDLTFADAVIAFYDAKYTYTFWRPVTAVRATNADPSWLPEVTNTPPDPSYPGAHAVISSAGATVLAAFLGGDRFEFTVTSEVLPGVERSFTRFSAAAREAASSRVFAGVHFGFDLTAGRRLGRQLAKLVDQRLLLPVRAVDQRRATAVARDRAVAERSARKRRIASSVVRPSARS
jgi:membrane-associated phospholipid phosphatase